MQDRDHDKPEEKRSGERAETGDTQDRVPPFIGGHPPIIITDDALLRFTSDSQDPATLTVVGDSMKIRFDGHTGHYAPDNAGNPTSYSASGIRINGVAVALPDDLDPHICPGVTRNSRIVVSAKKNGSTDRDITVTGSRNGIVIAFEHDEFPDEGSIGNRRRFHGTLRKIKRMEIFTPGQPTHRCPVVEDSGGECTIFIDDRH